MKSVHTATRVRHVDQLSETALARFLELLTSRTGTAVHPTEFLDGEVIVFTDYYRVTIS